MGDLTSRNFGLLIAYIIPGFVVLLGISPVSPTVQTWLSASAEPEQWPTVGGFLYVTLASVGLGMTTSAVRWFLVDRINEWTGLKRPEWDDSKLQANLAAFDLIVEQHYRHYQFYSNNMVALVVAYAVHRASSLNGLPIGWLEIGSITLLTIFWVTSRDVLRNYFNRTTTLLNQKDPQMANGNHPKSDTKPDTTKPSQVQSSTEGSKPNTPKPVSQGG